MTPLLPTQLAWLRRFATQNPLLIGWNAILVCGGLILLTYHAGIGYLPDFSTGELAGLLASVTFAGLLFIAIFVFLSFLPGILLRWLESTWPLIPYRRYFGWHETFILWGLPVILWVPYLVFAPELQRKSPLLSIYSFVALIAIASLLIAMNIRRRATPWSAMWKGKILSRQTVAFAAWTTTFFFPIYVVTNLAATAESDRGIATLVAAAILLTLFNSVLYAVPRKELGYGILVAAFLVAIFLPVLSGQPLLLAQGVMETFSLGHKNAATLTVSGKNCHGLSRFGIQCTANDLEGGVIELENVNVLTRVGTTVLLEILVKQSPRESAPANPRRSRSGTFSIDPVYRSLYCPMPDRLKPAQCSACDSLLVQRSPTEAGATSSAYRDQLICVRFTIPKSEILNMSFASKRKYDGYTNFALPVQPDEPHGSTTSSAP